MTRSQPGEWLVLTWTMVELIVECAFDWMDDLVSRLLRAHAAVDEFNKTVFSSDDRQEMLQELCRAIVTQGLYQMAWIGFFDVTTLLARPTASFGLVGEFFERLELNDEVSEQDDAESHAVANGRVFLCSDIRSDSRTLPWRTAALERGYRACATFPLAVGQRVVGVFKVYSTEVNVPAQQEIHILERLSSLISAALTNKRREEQRKRAEHQLRESEERYSRVSERMLELVCQLDDKKVFQFASPSHKRILGYETEQLLGKSFLEFISFEDLQNAENAFDSAIKTDDVIRIELRFRRSNDHYAWLEAAVDALKEDNGQVTGFVVASRNVTDRKQAESRLKSYTEDLESVVRERTERIQGLNQSITERLIQKINQINHISEIREQLKKGAGVEKSFDAILEGALKDLNMSIGAILTVNTETKSVILEALKSSEELEMERSYSLDVSYAEFECLKTHRAKSTVIGKEQTILRAKSVHCSPALLRNKLVAIMALGSDRDEILDESDLSVLSLYSALVTAAHESADLTVEPAKETPHARKEKYELNFGYNYLVEDNVELAFDLFTDKIMSGIDGLCVTRISPSRIRAEHGLLKTPIVWLTSESVNGERTINGLQDLSILISNYVTRVEKPVILVDGIEYLASHQGFDSMYHLLQSKRTQMEAAGGILIVPFFKDAFEPKEVKLLEREFTLFDQASPANEKKVKGEVNQRPIMRNRA
jgi:PAS domain S-box-containing protein